MPEDSCELDDSLTSESAGFFDKGNRRDNERGPPLSASSHSRRSGSNKSIEAPSAKRSVTFEPWSNRMNKAVTQSFHQTASVLSANMERLILEAEHNIYNLNNLEDRLVTLQQMLVLEDSNTVSAKSKLMESLWTRLGGNRKALETFNRRLVLLEGLDVFRRQALAHVIAALQTLLAMSEDMDDLRERVAAPILIGAAVPAEVQIRIVQIGLDRLWAERVRTKKIEEVAIETAM